MVDKNFNSAGQSFSGVDVIVSAISPSGKMLVLGDIQTISVSTHRDTTPIRALGIDRPLLYKQGTRTVSGTLVFTKIYKSAFNEMIQDEAHATIGDARGWATADRVVPFHIHMTKATEYGDDTERAVLRSVTLMSSGQAVSIHDVYSEQTYNYVAVEFLDFGMKEIIDNKEPVNSLSNYYDQNRIGQLT